MKTKPNSQNKPAALLPDPVTSPATQPEPPAQRLRTAVAQAIERLNEGALDSLAWQIEVHVKYADKEGLAR